MIQVAIGVVIFCLGLSIGYMISRRNAVQQVSGAIRVIQQEAEEPPYLFLEVYQSRLDDVYSNKKIVLEVIHENHIPQK